jgi:hypothetical protein
MTKNLGATITYDADVAFWLEHEEGGQELKKQLAALYDVKTELVVWDIQAGRRNEVPSGADLLLKIKSSGEAPEVTMDQIRQLPWPGYKMRLCVQFILSDEVAAEEIIEI